MPSYNNIPPIDAAGIFELVSPFVAEDGAVYRCESILGLDELEERGVDAYATYYEPQGIGVDQYNRDVLNAVSVCALMSASAATIYVPSSYIKSFPRRDNVPYSHVYLTVDLGPLPDELDVTDVLDAVEQEAAGLIGLPSLSARIHTTPYNTKVSLTEHDQLETLRLNRISESDSYKAQVIALQAELDETNAALTESQTMVATLKEVIDSLA